MPEKIEDKELETNNHIDRDFEKTVDISNNKDISQYYISVVNSIDYGIYGAFVFTQPPTTHIESSETERIIIRNECIYDEDADEPTGSRPPGNNRQQGEPFNPSYRVTSSSDYVNATHTIPYFISSKNANKTVSNIEVEYPKDFEVSSDLENDGLLELGVDDDNDYLVDTSINEDVTNIDVDTSKDIITVDVDSEHTLKEENSLIIKYANIENPDINGSKDYELKATVNNNKKPKTLSLSDCNKRSFAVNSSSYNIYTNYNFRKTSLGHYENGFYTVSNDPDIREGSDKLAGVEYYDFIDENNINIVYANNNISKRIQGSGQVGFLPFNSYHTLKMRSTEYDVMNISMPTELSESTWKRILSEDIEDGTVTNLEYVNNSDDTSYSGCSEYNYIHVLCTEDKATNRVIIRLDEGVYYINFGKVIIE